MADAKQLLKWACVALAVIGIIELSVGSWAIEAPYAITFTTVIIRNILGDGPKVAVAAGVLLTVAAVASLCANFESKTHLFVMGALFTLTLVLSTAAVGLSIKFNTDTGNTKMLKGRLKAVAGISGFSAIVNFLTMVIVILAAK